ncbi:MAG: aldehyde dehydrogenase family protein [Roseateles asaccharophilus]|uniref:Aldehyde dehydrogenase (NAD+)/betaine-aldehyde dehydrogenase n=1 Tax=Roseateles asaccharophilus TaxID=582607 RepID=A0A4R6MVF0_9BURK|nr:aldehyde dehydrogenase family protein [Roseateles asaccharophilus]MDN3544338.1 aldehyde dehydrogenase family protein [Roseateles asaccharophilus]TDP06419.1 aldehyde dehydrogenase (NAD+)/betaine-aldehyde dehydrogenase [Roseateles asaccharophilus]
MPADACEVPSNLIDGRPLPAESGQTLPVLDPADGQVFTRLPRSDARDVDAAVAAARRAFHGPWGRATAAERGRVLSRLAALILQQHEALAQLECRDTGKPIQQARADITACARYFEYYGGAADKLHGESIPYAAGSTVIALRVPHGVTGHIIPWNYPAQIFGRSVGGALAAGNACVVKPAEDACLTPLRIAALALEAGLPPGALNMVCGLGVEAGAALAAHPGINHISFTGSPGTGTAVAQAAALNHVPVTLELGGKSPQILFADADLDLALPVLLNAIVQNAGQTCAAGSRVLIERRIYAQVMEALAARFAALRTGPGLAGLDCGPLINARQLARVQALVEGGLADGIQAVARAQLAPEAPAGGFYFAPLLLDGVPPDHAIAQQELFGPVLAAFAFDSEEEAIALANGTPYGLTAAVWTRDGARQLRCAHAIEAGQVFINNYGAGGGIELPFGGMKHSGYGREKAFEGLRSFTTIKTIAISHG